jgi:hypothetical protein
MSNRRRLARERLEVYLVYLMLMYRPLILIGGVLLLMYAFVALLMSSMMGYAALIPALFLLLLGNSYNAVLYTARIGAWIGTLWRHDE